MSNPIPDGTQKTRCGKYTLSQWWQLSKGVESKCFDLYRQFIGIDDLVFDIGAHRGRKTWIFRKLGAKVIAVEPLAKFGLEWVPELYYEFGRDKGVTIVPAAVDHHDQKTVFWIHKNLSYLSSMNPRWREESAHKVFFNQKNSQKVTVNTTTLDSLVKRFGEPDFIKIDVEGHTNEAVKTLSVPVKALNMEFHEDWIPFAAIERVDSLAGYEWNYALDNRPKFVMKFWQKSESVLAHMANTLTKKGPGSWGDLYARRLDVPWS